MNLTSEQIEFMLEYFFGCAELKQITQTDALIASNPEAAKLYNNIKQALSQLDHLKSEECPSELVDITLARLKFAIDNPFPVAHQHQLQ